MPVCNYDGEVIGVAQIINKRGGSNNHEFTETDLKVYKYINIRTHKQCDITLYGCFYVRILNLMMNFNGFRFLGDTLHFAGSEYKMHSCSKFPS